MASFQTNYGAQVALQALRQIEHDSAVIQSRVSTGLKVATAKDSSVYWAIATATKSDGDVYDPVLSALGLGHSILDVTANGLAQVRTHLHDMRNLTFSALQPGADVVALQREFSSHQAAIRTISRSATINEQNRLRVDETIPPGGRRRQVVASFEKVDSQAHVSTIDLDAQEIAL